MTKRSACLMCGRLTDTRRYVALRWQTSNSIIDSAYWGRRVCDECYAEIPELVGCHLVARIEEVRQATPRPDEDWSDLYE